jgi:hypothetical protein
VRTSIKRFISRGVGLAVAGVAGLALAATATSATSTIQVSPLTIVSGTANGSISGFQPGGAVTVNGGTFTADGSGTVTLTAASLGGSATLTIGFVDGGGTPQTVSGALKDAVTGTPLSAAEVQDPIPSISAPMTFNVESSGTTTTTTTGGTTTSTTTGGTTTATTTTTTGGGGTTTGSGGSAGGSTGAASIAGAVRLSDGLWSIPSTSVRSPHRLVIRNVVFTPKLVSSRSKPITIRIRVRDSRGMVVRNAAVWMRTLPLQLVTSVKTKRTSSTGWVTFTVRPTKLLKLTKGGRVNIFVRASTPGQPIIGGTSTSRLVSLGTTTAH